MSSTPSVFKAVPTAPEDSILGVKAKFLADPSPNKINVSIGAYRTDDGKPFVLRCVRAAEEALIADKSLDKEYLTQRGLAQFCTLAREVMLGKDCPAIAAGRVATIQALSGTGGLRIAAEFIKRFIAPPAVYIPAPTWANHNTILRDTGLVGRTYRYWDAATRGLDLDGMMADLNGADRGSIVLLHACAHNPTGVDPTHKQWEAIAEVCVQRGLIPWFDSAYQGFSSGSLDVDAWAVRHFVSRGLELLICQSFAKNFGLYGERIGAFSVVVSDPFVVAPVLSQLDVIVRGVYSSPPLHGARIVARVLSDPKLRAMWDEELKEMSGRILSMRAALRAEIEALGTPGTWSHITDQIGMFSYTGLTPEQCDAMTKDHHIYLLRSGRISMAGINTKNVKYFAKAIHDVVTKKQ